MHVDKAGGTIIDALPQRGIGLIGGTEANGVGLRQGAVEGWAGGRAGENSDLKLASGAVFGNGPGGDGERNRLGYARGRKTAEADGLIVLDERGGFFGGQYRKAGPPDGTDGSGCNFFFDQSGWHIFSRAGSRPAQKFKSFRAACSGLRRPAFTDCVTDGSSAATCGCWRKRSSRPEATSSCIQSSDC